MKKILFLFVFFFFLLIGLYFYLSQDFKKAEPTVYYNGNIITMDEASPSAEAMLVVDGMIGAIGTESDVIIGVEKDIEKVDLQGQTVMPGFIDPHTHFALSMFLSDMHDLSGFRFQTNEQIWNEFENVANQVDKGEWIICKGLDPILVPDLEPPTLAYLDSIVPNNPVMMISQSLHNYWVNSEALLRAGIDNDTSDPSDNSYYERDDTGKLSGGIVEQLAIQPVIGVLEKEVLTSELLRNAATTVMQSYAQNGNTTIVSTGLSIQDEKPLLLLQHLSDSKPTLLTNLLAKLSYLPPRSQNPRHFVYMRHDRTHLLPPAKTENDFYNIIGVKHWMDGSPYIGSMYLSEPYIESELANQILHIKPGHKGEALVEKDKLKSFLKTYHENGWQIAVHCQGGPANKEVIDAFEELNKFSDIKTSRHRLEHCLLLQESDLDRMKKLNLTPSFHINHIYYYGDALRDDLIGEERAEQLLPIKATQQAGIKFSMHADQPMFESSPFRLIQTAIERRSQQGNKIAEAYSIDLMQAVKAMTIDAAWQIHMEDKLGSLEVGKYADFVVMDRNPFDVATSELEKINFISTYVNGNKVNYR